MTIRTYVELMKLRIGLMVALMAVMGYVAVADRVNPVRLAVLAVAMLLGSASSSVFNHFYDRDIDRLMARTCRRPLASGQTANPSRVLWLAGALLVAGCGLAVMVLNLVVALHLFLGAFFYAIVYTVWLKRRTGSTLSSAVRRGASPYWPAAPRSIRRAGCSNSCCPSRCFFGRQAISGASPFCSRMITPRPMFPCCRWCAATRRRPKRFFSTACFWSRRRCCRWRSVPWDGSTASAPWRWAPGSCG